MPTIGGRRSRSRRANQFPARDMTYRRASSFRACAVPPPSSNRAVPVTLGASGATVPRTEHGATRTCGLVRIRLTLPEPASVTIQSSAPCGTCQTGVVTGVPFLR